MARSKFESNFTVVNSTKSLLVVACRKYCGCVVLSAATVIAVLYLCVNTPSFLLRVHSHRVNLPDKSWRRTNWPVFEFRPGVARRHESLVARFANDDDPELVQLARDVIDWPPSPEIVSLGIKRSRTIVSTPQADKVDQINMNKQRGFFIECGALDGERSSNTIWLEEQRGWTGLLIEMDPHFYTQLLGKNRNVWSANVCLSPYKRASILERQGSIGGSGHLQFLQNNDADTAEGSKSKPHPLLQGQRHGSIVQQTPIGHCFPLATLLLAINRTKIDYFSLDVEGAELDVLKTIPWSDSRFDIDILSVEYRHVTKGKQALLDYMTGADASGPRYQMVADLVISQPEKYLYVDDFIFVKN